MFFHPHASPSLHYLDLYIPDLSVALKYNPEKSLKSHIAPSGWETQQ